MTQLPVGQLVAESAAPGDSHNELIERIAAAVEKRSMVNLGGIDRIEDRHTADVLAYPTTNTVFAVIQAELEAVGISQDGTIGGVMTGLGFGDDPVQAYIQAHEIGCECRGPNISPGKAAGRIRNLKT